MEAEDNQPTTSKLVTIQRIQADPDLERPAKEERGPDAPPMPTQEVWSEEDTLGWETQDDDTWESQQDEEEVANYLALLNMKL